MMAPAAGDGGGTAGGRHEISRVMGLAELFQPLWETAEALFEKAARACSAEEAIKLRACHLLIVLECEHVGWLPCIPVPVPEEVAREMDVVRARCKSAEGRRVECGCDHGRDGGEEEKGDDSDEEEEEESDDDDDDTFGGPSLNMFSVGAMEIRNFVVSRLADPSDQTALRSVYSRMGAFAFNWWRILYSNNRGLAYMA